MKTPLIVFIAVLFLISQLPAQDIPTVRFKKVSDEEMNMNVYEPDTTARAVILFDNGQSNLTYNVSKNSFILEYERFVRIKILKQEGTSWGNFLIPLYSSGQNKEQTGVLDGATFNLEGGKTEKTELKKESIFQERENKFWEVVKISMPAVKVGSVIDLRYTITSPLIWNLHTWKFQYTIPVKWSQYEVIFPEYFTYNQSSLGYHSLFSQNHSTKNVSINFTTKTSSNDAGNPGGNNFENQKISYIANTFNYAAREVPAIKEEPYLTTLENFTTRMKFELASTDFTRIGGKYKAYTNSWDDIVNELLDDEDFGGQIKSGNSVEDIVNNLTTGKSTEMDKAIAIYDYIQHNMKWNDVKNFMTSRSLKKSLAEKNGNSADINLLLLTMLRKSGISADPVLLSTRDHGLLSPVFATLTDCNYVIAKAMIDGNPVLFDATEPDLPAGMIPFRCLNGNGVRILKESPEEVSLTNTASGKTTTITAELKDGKLAGKIVSRLTGLNAFNFREEVKKAGGAQEHFDKLKNKTADLQYLDFSYANLDSIYLQIEKNYTVENDQTAESENEILYINPILSERLQKNPFSSPSREYPVDFGNSFYEYYVLDLKVPEGYMVEELPQKKMFALGAKAGLYSYQAAEMNGRIIVSTRFKIEKPLFLPEEYNSLKSFFDLVVAKESEQIIFKKIN